MDVLVTGRHCTVSDEFRDHVMEKISKVERLRDRVIRIEVQVSAYGNKRNPDEGSRVEITLHSKGPLVRAEATADDKMAAFEHAMDRLRTQLRRAADRRKVHRGQRSPQGLRQATAALPDLPLEPSPEPHDEEENGKRNVAGIEVEGDGPLVVREKTFPQVPMTLAQALDQMELVGHDFYLFHDADTGLASCAYKRKGYTYGVIRLDPEATTETNSEAS
ncbi:ribosome hibernation-promoting factor, HPF/YfiA family [Enemella sp. A6]|uniref:ribosome hibernation-promoting factor, HPF/YfiA family n=1 Tax=Enemella sp. A6 TaxID=3440152 RepID=UPI003EBECAF1